jgi:pilus assembly protein CpaB
VNMKMILLFGVAILIASVAALYSYKHLQKNVKAVAPPSYESRLVAVAVSDLTWGTTLSRNMVKTVPYLRESLPPGSFSDPAALTGRVLLSPVKANEPVLESRLAPTTITAGGIAAVVTPNSRAMSVKVDRVTGIAGFIHPGNRVDVLVTIQDREKNRAPITKTVLENILVLAAGPQIEKDGKRERPTQVDVITLEVTPREGEKLALAASEGKIQLALRNYTDGKNVVTRGVTIPALLAYSRKKEVDKTQKTALVTPSVISVQLIKGSSVSELNFEKGGE